MREAVSQLGLILLIAINLPEGNEELGKVLMANNITTAPHLQTKKHQAILVFFIVFFCPNYSA
jgi:hypothetical protein